MSASPIKDNACRRCGEVLAPESRFCPSCGAPAGELPPLETVPGPVVQENIERRWLGLPARFVVLCLGFAALGASIGLFATGSWAWAVVLLLVAVILLAALGEATRRGSDVWMQHSARLASDGRAQAATAAEVWRTRFDSRLSRWRTQTRLDAIEVERGPALQALGEAVWRQDEEAERAARQRIVDLEQEAKRVEDELAERLAGAEERIRRARLPVQDTVMVTPNEPSVAGSVGGKAAATRLEDRRPEGPSQPYPPPDEGNPPEPAQVPEPYPPPDEGTPPAPAPDPSLPESE